MVMAGYRPIGVSELKLSESAEQSSCECEAVGCEMSLACFNGKVQKVTIGHSLRLPQDALVKVRTN